MKKTLKNVFASRDGHSLSVRRMIKKVILEVLELRLASCLVRFHKDLGQNCFFSSKIPSFVEALISHNSETVGPFEPKLCVLHGAMFQDLSRQDQDKSRSIQLTP
jgi:hypothetical protein